VLHETLTVARSTGALECPYKGLLAYEEADAGYFFGRDEAREVIGANVIASKLTILYGASGVGKSSVLRAGVIPDLRRLATASQRTVRGPEYVPVVIGRWSGDVRAEVYAQIAGAVAALGIVVESPPPADAPLAELFEQWATLTDGTLLVILDQFEEFLLYQAGRFDQPGLATELGLALTREDLAANFLISIREDAIARLDRFKGLVPHLFDNYLRLAHLDTTAALEAIERPIDAWNEEHTTDEPIRVEAALTAAVIKQVATGSIAMPNTGRGGVDDESPGAVEAPFLQLVMTTIWSEERPEDSGWLRLATLLRLGGAERIVRTHLERRMQQLTQAQQDIASRIFHHLVTPSGTKVAHRASDLASYSGMSPATLRPVLERLASGEWRILRIVDQASATGDEPRYEIFHDVLAQAVLEWRTRHEERRAALDAVAAERSRVRRRRLGWLRRVVAFALLALLLVLGALALARRGDADKTSAMLRTAQDAVKSHELAMNARLALATDREAAVQLARRAAGESMTADAMAALRSAMFLPRVVTALRAPGRSSIDGIALSSDGRLIAASTDFGSSLTWHVESPRSPPSVASPRSAAVGDPSFSADARWTVSGLDNGAVVVRDAATAEKTRRLQACEQSAGSDALRFGDPGSSPARPAPVWAGNRSIVLACDGTVLVWRPWSLRITSRLTIGSRVTVLALSPRSGLVAAGARDGSVTIVDPDRGRALRRLGHDGAVRSLSFSPDGRQVAVGTDGGSWLGGVAAGTTQSLDTVAALVGPYSDDGRRVVTSTRDGSANVWETASGRAQARLTGHAGEISSLDLSADGRAVLTAGTDQTARLWDARSGIELAVMRDRDRPLTRAMFGRGVLSDRIVTAGGDSTVRIWQPTAVHVATVRLTAPASVAGFARSSRTLWTLSQDGALTIWDWQRELGRTVLAADRARTARRVAISDDGATAAVADDDGSLRLVNVAAGRVERRLDSDGNVPTFSRDGRWIGAVSGDGSVDVFGSVDGGRVFDLNANTPLEEVSFSDDGRMILASGPYGAYAWSIPSRRLVARLPATAPDDDPAAAVIPPDRSGDWLVAPAGAAVQLLNLDSGSTRRLEVPGVRLTTAAITPDGAVAAAGSDAGIVWLWDTATGESLAALDTGELSFVTFSADGRFIVVGGHRKLAEVYRCDACVPIDRASLGR
jgi:WD40 repeat protein